MKITSHSKLLALLLPVLLVACGGGGGGSAVAAEPATSQQQLAVLEANGSIPKLDRSSALAGTDADGNGIRDDIDSFIAANYKNPSERTAVQQIAKSYQSVLTVDLKDPVAIKAVSDFETRAIHCVHIRFAGVNSSNNPSAVSSEIKSISTNTKPRLLQLLAYSNALDGSVFSLPKGDTCD